MELDRLTAISPIDGRYRERTRPLAKWFSELGLIRYRLWVELEYFTFLCEVPLPELQGTDTARLAPVRDRLRDLGTGDAQRVKAIEEVTNHDVKAVEYFLKELLEDAGLGSAKEFVHFGLPSQDVNHTALPLLAAVRPSGPARSCGVRPRMRGWAPHERGDHRSHPTY